MQKLANTRWNSPWIEAGRMEGQFTAVDIGAFTADLASSFRSAIEKAGMQLHLDLGPVTDEVYVDPGYLGEDHPQPCIQRIQIYHRGSIAVSVRQNNGEVRVSITDTGIGIPADQLDRISIASTGWRTPQCAARKAVHLIVFPGQGTGPDPSWAY